MDWKLGGVDDLFEQFKENSDKGRAIRKYYSRGYLIVCGSYVYARSLEGNTAVPIHIAQQLPRNTSRYIRFYKILIPGRHLVRQLHEDIKSLSHDRHLQKGSVSRISTDKIRKFIDRKLRSDKVVISQGHFVYSSDASWINLWIIEDLIEDMGGFSNSHHIWIAPLPDNPNDLHAYHFENIAIKNDTDPQSTELSGLHPGTSAKPKGRKSRQISSRASYRQVVSGNYRERSVSPASASPSPPWSPPYRERSVSPASASPSPPWSPPPMETAGQYSTSWADNTSQQSGAEEQSVPKISVQSSASPSPPLSLSSGTGNSSSNEDKLPTRESSEPVHSDDLDGENKSSANDSGIQTESSEASASNSVTQPGPRRSSSPMEKLLPPQGESEKGVSPEESPGKILAEPPGLKLVPPLARNIVSGQDLQQPPANLQQPPANLQQPPANQQAPVGANATPQRLPEFPAVSKAGLLITLEELQQRRKETLDAVLKPLNQGLLIFFEGRMVVHHYSDADRHFNPMIFGLLMLSANSANIAANNPDYIWVSQHNARGQILGFTPIPTGSPPTPTPTPTPSPASPEATPPAHSDSSPEQQAGVEHYSSPADHYAARTGLPTLTTVEEERTRQEVVTQQKALALSGAVASGGGDVPPLVIPLKTNEKTDNKAAPSRKKKRQPKPPSHPVASNSPAIISGSPLKLALFIGAPFTAVSAVLLAFVRQYWPESPPEQGKEPAQALVNNAATLEPNSVKASEATSSPDPTPEADIQDINEAGEATPVRKGLKLDHQQALIRRHPQWPMQELISQLLYFDSMVIDPFFYSQAGEILPAAYKSTIKKYRLEYFKQPNRMLHLIPGRHLRRFSTLSQKEKDYLLDTISPWIIDAYNSINLDPLSTFHWLILLCGMPGPDIEMLGCYKHSVALLKQGWHKTPEASPLLDSFLQTFSRGKGKKWLLTVSWPVTGRSSLAAEPDIIPVIYGLDRFELVPPKKYYEHSNSRVSLEQIEILEQMGLEVLRAHFQWQPWQPSDLDVRGSLQRRDCPGIRGPGDAEKT